MKKNNKLIILLMVIIGVVLVGSGTTLIILNKMDNNVVNTSKGKKSKEAYEALDKLLKYESYNITVNEYIYKTGNEYDLYDSLKVDLNFKEEFEYIDGGFTHKYYNYKGKQIYFTDNEESGEVLWYYKPENLLSDKNVFYSNNVIKLIEDLKSSEILNEDNSIVIKDADKLIDSLDSIYNINEIESYLPVEGYGEPPVAKIDNVNIILENKDIETIEFYIYDSFDKDGTRIVNQKVTITFNNFNKIDGKLPDDVISSLEKTVAGDWVGTYSYAKTCSNGATMTQKLTFTNEFDWMHGRGWDLVVNVENDCSTGKSNNSKETYYFKEDKIVVVDFFGDIIMEGQFKENKIILFDYKSSTEETFVKE